MLFFFVLFSNFCIRLFLFLCYIGYVALIEGDYMETNSKKDIKFVMSIFVLIILMLVFTMISNFKIIDGCYFIIVLFFATRYLLLSRD